MQPAPRCPQQELLPGLGREQCRPRMDGVSLERCHRSTSGSCLLHSLPGAGTALPPSLSSLQPLHGGEHRCKHQTPSRVPVPGVSSVVQPGVRVAKQPVSHRWVSMAMEQECGGGGVEAEQMLLLLTDLHPCPKPLYRPAGMGMQRVQEPGSSVGTGRVQVGK